MRKRKNYTATCERCGELITRMDRHLNITDRWFHYDTRFRHDHEPFPK